MSNKKIASVEIANPYYAQFIEMLPSPDPSQVGKRLPKEVNTALFWLAKAPEVAKVLAENGITNLHRQWNKYTDFWSKGKLVFSIKTENAPAPAREEPTDAELTKLIAKLDRLTELYNKGLLPEELYVKFVNELA